MIPAKFPRLSTILVVALLCLIAALAGPVRMPAQSSATTAQLAAQPGYPVTVEGYEILRIYTGLGSFSARDRAQAVDERLRKLIYVPDADLANLTVESSPFGASINLRNDVLLVVSDEDAKTVHLAPDVLAKYYVTRIQKGIATVRQQHSKRFLITAAVYGVVTLLVYLGLVWLVVAGSRRLLRRLRSAGPQLRGVKIQQSELLTGSRIAAVLASIVSLLRLALLFVLTWIFLATEFNYFPWTREHGKQLLDYFITPVLLVVHGFINYLPNLFYIFVIVAVMHYALKFIKLLAGEFERGNIRITGFYPEWVQPTYKIIRFLLWAFTAVMIYPYLPGEGSPAFKGIGLFIGVLFSLGSTSAIANIVAGVILTYTRGFRVGDWVKIGDNMGEVTSQSMLATHLQTIKNEEIIIPNSVVLNSYVTNFSLLAQGDGLILHTSVTIGYDAPWRKIHSLLIEAALKTEHILAQPAPFVLQNALDDSYVEYEINAYTDQPREMVYIYSALRANIQDCFYAGGVEIMSPVYSALRDGNHAAIPAEYLPKDYRPQGFRVDRGNSAVAASAGKE